MIKTIEVTIDEHDEKANEIISIRTRLLVLLIFMVFTTFISILIPFLFSMVGILITPLTVMVWFAIIILADITIGLMYMRNEIKILNFDSLLTKVKNGEVE